MTSVMGDGSDLVTLQVDHPEDNMGVDHPLFGDEIMTQVEVSIVMGVQKNLPGWFLKHGKSKNSMDKLGVPLF